MENYKRQIKDVSDIVKGKTKLFLKKNVKYDEGGMNNHEIGVDRACGFLLGLVFKRSQYRPGSAARPALIFDVFPTAK